MQMQQHAMQMQQLATQLQLQQQQGNDDQELLQQFVGHANYMQHQAQQVHQQAQQMQHHQQQQELHVVWHQNAPQQAPTPVPAAAATSTPGQAPPPPPPPPPAQGSRVQKAMEPNHDFREMEEPMSDSWGLAISDADFAKLRQGLTPRDMDDRWIFRVGPVDRSGVITIYIARSWTSIQHYAIHILPGREGEPETTRIIAIMWEQNTSGVLITNHQAQKEFVMISRSLLECDFDNYPSDLEWFGPEHDIDKDIDKKHHIEFRCD
ncbi:hypothetical protein SCUCBS95973_002381 [Sporothrix curviconia]|uniref:Uncharacterized protein n=1 Tax=Sporothrix curviconia TaxID=1260050 RepID=A0ABP0B6E7_9PEZI